MQLKIKNTKRMAIQYRMHRFAALVALLLAGCGGISSLWPFGDSGGKELSRVPPNATEYKCDGNRGFYVRNLEGGDVWLIAPDREIRLAKRGAGWGSGRASLELDGDNATLVDPPASFSGCKRAAKTS
jgi:hypothetical protein